MEYPDSYETVTANQYREREDGEVTHEQHVHTGHSLYELIRQYESFFYMKEECEREAVLGF